MTHDTVSVVGAHGLQLFAQRWAPELDAKAAVAIISSGTLMYYFVFLVYSKGD